jgi:hypothetical protein
MTDHPAHSQAERPDPASGDAPMGRGGAAGDDWDPGRAAVPSDGERRQHVDAYTHSAQGGEPGGPSANATDELDGEVFTLDLDTFDIHPNRGEAEEGSGAGHDPSGKRADTEGEQPSPGQLPGAVAARSERESSGDDRAVPPPRNGGREGATVGEERGTRERGRPRKADPRTLVSRVYFSQEEKAQADQNAKASGRRLAVYLREMGLGKGAYRALDLAKLTGYLSGIEKDAISALDVVANHAVAAENGAEIAGAEDELSRTAASLRAALERCRDAQSLVVDLMLDARSSEKEGGEQGGAERKRRRGRKTGSPSGERTGSDPGQGGDAAASVRADQRGGRGHQADSSREGGGYGF